MRAQLAIDSSNWPTVALVLVGAIAVAYVLRVRADARLWRRVNAWRMKAQAVAHPATPRAVLRSWIAEGEELVARCARKAKTDWMHLTGIASWSDEVTIIHATLRATCLAAGETGHAGSPPE